MAVFLALMVIAMLSSLADLQKFRGDLIPLSKSPKRRGEELDIALEDRILITDPCKLCFFSPEGIPLPLARLSMCCLSGGRYDTPCQAAKCGGENMKQCWPCQDGWFRDRLHIKPMRQ
eukprot:TRINITY_DN2281_c0_g1_i3.p7 TRINITY_DN2281_c0_g1~~TRINITY_DN2281_c0_g1_i3.p7  ORF type:complete len:126 (+),score=10.89 TRINITY_DN2281_c0_g1_i3:25-378(+)